MSLSPKMFNVIGAGGLMRESSVEDIEVMLIDVVQCGVSFLAPQGGAFFCGCSLTLFKIILIYLSSRAKQLR